MRSPKKRANRCIAVLAERYHGGQLAEKVFCYVGAGWYFPGQTIRDLKDEMQRHLDAGYTMLKMKVGGLKLTEDMRRIEAVKAMMPAGSQLAVDANSKFDRGDALAYARALVPFKLRWFEEPCDPLDFALLAEIATAMTRHLRAEKICSRLKTCRTLSVSAGSAPTATMSSRWTHPKPTG